MFHAHRAVLPLKQSLDVTPTMNPLERYNRNKYAALNNAACSNAFAGI